MAESGTNYFTLAERERALRDGIRDFVYQLKLPEKVYDYSFTTTSGTVEIPLPDDYYFLLAVAHLDNQGEYTGIYRQRNEVYWYDYYFYDIVFTSSPPTLRVKAPPQGGKLRIIYVPQPTLPTSDSDEVLPELKFLEPFFDAIVLYAAYRLLQKDQNGLYAQKRADYEETIMKARKAVRAPFAEYISYLDRY